MISDLSIPKKVLLGHATVIALLLVAVLTASLTIDRLETAVVDPSGSEAARRHIHALELVIWATLGVGTALSLFWAVYISRRTRRMSRVVDPCRAVSARVAETAADCAAGSRSVLEGVKAAEGTKSEIDRVVRSMLALSSKVRGIRRAQEVIAELSDKVTVLSYNAALEAAAGGTGRSFAAVAEQLERVADDARLAVESVRGIVQDIQDATNRTILATEESLKAAERGLKVQREASEKVHSITESVQFAHRAVRGIEGDTPEETATTREVKERIAQVVVSAERLGVSSEQMASRARDLLESFRIVNQR